MWMSEKEIVERYVNGIDDKFTMCKILAELNGVSFNRIVTIVNKAGYKVPERRAKAQYTRLKGV